jgi:hypothetical protein
MAIVFDAWSSHLSQFAPAPYVSGVPAAVYEHMQNNSEIICIIYNLTMSVMGVRLFCLNFDQFVYLPICILTILPN